MIERFILWNFIFQLKNYKIMEKQVNAASEVYDESEGGVRFIILLIIAAILTAVNYFLYAGKHCAVKSTSIN